MSTRRTISLTVTEVSRAVTTPPKSPPQRIQKVFRIQEHPAAASKPQQAGFPQMLGSLGTGLWKQWRYRESVGSRTGIQETGASLDRESVVPTVFSSQSKG